MNASASSSVSSMGTNKLIGKYELGKAVDFITTGKQKFVRLFNDLGTNAMGT